MSVEPPLLKDVLLDLLAAEPDIELMDYVAQSDDAPTPVHGRTPDVLIISSPNPEDEARPVHLLFSIPGCRVLALRNDARRSFLYELRPHRSFLGELSREALLTAVRGLPAVEDS